jgi:glucose/arabinose dehydrogenase
MKKNQFLFFLFNTLIISSLVAEERSVLSESAALDVEPAFPHLLFDRPVDLQDPRDESSRLFVLEQEGVIRVFKNSKDTKESKIFLDLRSKVAYDGNEEGLLGLAYHPDFKKNGFFYVDYTASKPLRTVIERYKVSGNNPDQADLQSGEILLEILQPYSNHNGGQISFGPDGYLYIAMGDGGSAGDPHGNGQNVKSLLGKILRIDVNRRNGSKKYGIPEDNPFFKNTSGYQEEIYAYGLRNPWRFSWDRTGRLWVADVGQNKIEEVNIVEKGKNYGWNIMEGSRCFKPSFGCDTRGLEMPIAEYDHNVGLSITGGFVYYGLRVPDLVGSYIYADYVTGRFWALKYDGKNKAETREILKTDLNISSFGIDEKNELYICSFDGKIYHFVNKEEN